jgi:hypothetical protein
MAPQKARLAKYVGLLIYYIYIGLRKAVAIPSISAQDENRKDVFRVSVTQLPLTRLPDN